MIINCKMATSNTKLVEVQPNDSLKVYWENLI